MYWTIQRTLFKHCQNLIVGCQTTNTGQVGGTHDQCFEPRRGGRVTAFVTGTRIPAVVRNSSKLPQICVNFIFVNGALIAPT